jgi:hypothetical protein
MLSQVNRNGETWKGFDVKDLSKNEGCLFVCLFVLFCFVCTYEIHQTGMLQIVFFVSLESSRGGGVHRVGFMAFVV